MSVQKFRGTKILLIGVRGLSDGIDIFFPLFLPTRNLLNVPFIGIKSNEGAENVRFGLPELLERTNRFEHYRKRVLTCQEQYFFLVLTESYNKYLKETWLWAEISYIKAGYMVHKFFFFFFL